MNEGMNIHCVVCVVYFTKRFTSSAKYDAKHMFSYLDFRCCFEANGQNHIHFWLIQVLKNSMAWHFHTFRSLSYGSPGGPHSDFVYIFHFSIFVFHFLIFSSPFTFSVFIFYFSVSVLNVLIFTSPFCFSIEFFFTFPFPFLTFWFSLLHFAFRFLFFLLFHFCFLLSYFYRSI